MPRTVLVVDDEPKVRAVAAAFLETLGYQVLQAGDGLQALELFDEHRDEIALVLSDVMMPEFDGFELAQTLAEIGCKAPIGFMTGCVPELEADRDRFAGAGAVIQKPFGEKDLAVFVRRVLDAQEAA
jgi:CheY-like chemotaxis protein